MPTVAPDKPIALSDELLIGSRQTRRVYRHPDRPDLVLKIEIRKAPASKRWYERQPFIATSMERELRGYADLLVRLGEQKAWISRIYGLENTSLGPAVLAENVTFGFDTHAVLKDVLKGRSDLRMTGDEMRHLARRYRDIGTVLTERDIFTHGIRPENFMVVRREGVFDLRMFDYKTNIYRQLISPRLIPGAERYEQRRKMAEVQAQFDRWLQRLAA